MTADAVPQYESTGRCRTCQQFGHYDCASADIAHDPGCDRDHYPHDECNPPAPTAGTWADDIAAGYGHGMYPRELLSRTPIWSWYRSAAEREGALYAEAIRGAAAMRHAAINYDDSGYGADAEERAHGIPENAR